MRRGVLWALLLSFLLAGCAPAMSLFCLGFVERLLDLSENQASNGKEMVANETADCCTG